MWDLPRPGLEPVSPALAGRFSTTAPPGKPCKTFFIHHNVLVNSGILKSLSWKCMLVPYKSWPAVFSQASVSFFAHHHVMSVLVFSPRWLNPPQQKCFYISITLCSSLCLTITFLTYIGEVHKSEVYNARHFYRVTHPCSHHPNEETAYYHCLRSFPNALSQSPLS